MTANYAIKGTAVGTLFQSFTSGASVPYFGCYVLKTGEFYAHFGNIFAHHDRPSKLR